MTCAIADLGLCVKHEAESDTVDLPNNRKVGTKRYLAPELLDETLNPQHFDSWKRADVHSLGKVFFREMHMLHLFMLFKKFREITRRSCFLGAGKTLLRWWNQG